MPSNYERIAEDNTRKYGTDIDRYGPVLLAHLYSDRTHFVYELLQNAEDAGAKQIKFSLFADRLEVRHYGGRPFDEVDVRGICGLVEGTKKEDLTQIGKFGIGFKSVYAYTHTPHIYCGNEAFYIKSYVRPFAATQVELKDKETLFIFPFNREENAPTERAFNEITERLNHLGSRTLLFLNNIEEVSWTNGRVSGTYTRKATPLGAHSRKIHLTSSNVDCKTGDLSSTVETWLVFDRPIIADHTNSSKLKVEVAFRLEQKSKEDKEAIVPVDRSSLVVFFPTEKETHLKFLIQGPYRTTPARDNIPKDDEWNVRLIKETADLIADIIPVIKERGLLTVDFLNILPIAKDSFPPEFYPIYNRVLEELRSNEEFLPTSDGGYVSSQRAFLSRGKELISLLTTEQLVSLFGRRDSKWLDANITNDKTPKLRQYLMNELGIVEVDQEKFARQIDDKFMKIQNDDWVRKFYSFLFGRTELLKAGGSGILSSKPIIRLSNNTHVYPFKPNGQPKAYLPGKFDSSFPTIKKTIVDDSDARKFLTSVGFATFDIYAEVIEQILPRYRGDTLPKYEEGLDHHRKIAQALKDAPYDRRRKLMTEIKTLRILFGQKRSDKQPSLHYPSDNLYLSSKYTKNDELETFFKAIGAENAIFLDEGYVGIYDADTLIEMGCAGKLDRVREVKKYLLPKYRTDGRMPEEAIKISENANFRDVEVIIQTLATITNPRDREGFIKELQSYPFLRAVNAPGGKRWRKPSEIYLNSLFTRNNAVEIYFERNPNIYFLDEIYKKLDANQIFSNLGCLSEINVTLRKPNREDGHVTIQSEYGGHKRGLDGFDPGFNVDGLEYALKHITVPKAQIIWDILKRYHYTIKGVMELSTSQNYISDKTQRRESYSKAGDLVRKEAWLPDKIGKFHIPFDIRLSELPNSFDIGSQVAKLLAERLHCKPEVDLSQFSEKEKEKISFAMTLTDDEIGVIEQQRRKERDTPPENDGEYRPASSGEDDDSYEDFSYSDELREAFDHSQIKDHEDYYPPDEIADPQRRREKIQQEIQDTKNAERQRFKKVPAKKWEGKNSQVKVFLKSQYNGRCQICEDTFIQRNGEPYFEGLYLVSRTKRAWIDREGNVLCLCANCCAKLLHGQVEFEGDDVVKYIMSFKARNEGGIDEQVIDFRLCGEEVRLTFSERHILDLQEMLRADSSE